jgi:NosR/NirI family nitrous oxide reductase transcriptional regulator
LGQDLDGVTGATFTCRALSESVRKASRNIAAHVLNFPQIPEPEIEIVFRTQEAFLILLFLLSFIGYYRKFKYKKVLRWITLLAGMVVIGFIFNLPLTLIFINKMLLGYFPQWQFNLYFYILLTGVFLSLILLKKNPYCDWFCPFGASQEFLALIGGGNTHPPKWLSYTLRWAQRILALAVITAALIYRHPGIHSYEVFGAFFHLVGSVFLFSLLGIFLILSLFIKRPWCHFLCPLRAVSDLIRLFRDWVLKKTFQENG